MTPAAAKRNLSRFIERVKTASFEEKKDLQTEEEVINTFLDRILEFKKLLKASTEKLNGISTELEGLTWFQNPDDEILSQLNTLIVLCKDLRSTLVKKYVSFNSLRSTGVARAEIVDYKLAIDLFIESYSDIELAFFILPRNKEFQDVNRKLAS